MKSLFKILIRYVASAGGVALTLLVLNFVVIAIWLVQSVESRPTYTNFDEIAAGLTRQGDGFVLTGVGEAAIRRQYQWAMLLNDQGQVIWSEALPAGLPRQYSAADVASFTRWYLQDYPVHVWRHPDGLLVLGQAPGTDWKHDIEMPASMMNNLISWMGVGFILNGIAAVLLALLFGLRLLRSLRPLIKGIEDMAEKRPVALATGGLLGDLAEKINQTSAQLSRQEAALQKRDTARTTWIAGVSHDIRTPLSMVLGYASQLEHNPQLPQAQQEQARIIRAQSEKIGALVSDLNLASKLEYSLQPLRTETVYPAELARSIITDYLNNGLDACYTLDLQVGSDGQSAAVLADAVLLRRAITNLIDNSIRHNPEGCAIQVSIEKGLNDCAIAVSDNGAGFPEAVLAGFDQADDPEVIHTHGLGLTIVRQIALAHGGTLTLDNVSPSNCQAVLRLPLLQ